MKNFEINLIFLINSFLLHDQNVKTKTWISWEQKDLLRWNKMHFSSFLKDFHWSNKEIFFFLEGESPTLIYSIISFNRDLEGRIQILVLKKRAINSWVIFSLREASQYLKSYGHFDN